MNNQVFYLSIILTFAFHARKIIMTLALVLQFYGDGWCFYPCNTFAQMLATDPSGNSWDVADSTDSAGRVADVFYRFKDSRFNRLSACLRPFQVSGENVNPDSLPFALFLTTFYKLRAIGSNVKFDIYDL